MNDLVRYDDGASPVQVRRASRAISRSKSLSQVRQARVMDETEVAIEKVESVSYATVHAMGAVTRVNQVLHQIEQQAPELAGRLNRLADFHELAVAQELEDLRRDLRRR